MTKSADFCKKIKKSYDVYTLAPREYIIKENCRLEDILCFVPPFAVQGFLHEKRRDRQVLRHVNYGGYSLHFLCGGRFFYRFDGKELAMNPGEVFIQTSGSGVEMGRPEGFGSDRLILFLTGSQLPGLMRSLGFVSPLLIHPDDPDKIQTSFEEFKTLLQDETQMPLLIGKTAELLTRLAEIHGTFRKGLPDKMAYALKFIQRNLQTGFTLAELSNFLELTQYATKKQFQACFGCTPFELLCKERLKCAAEMLESGDLSIKEISTRCGFSTPRYFADAFRKVYHCSPRSYSERL